jgi:hypothetical protein
VLWERQRNVEILDICPQQLEDPRSNGKTTDLIKVLENITFPNLQGIHAVIDTAESAALTSTALQRGVISELCVDAKFWLEGQAHEVDGDGSDEDTPQVQDAMTTLIFGHLTKAKPGHLAPFDLLETLTLKDIDLSLCKYTWFTYLELPRLHKLELKYCKGADLFLMQFCAKTTPALKSFILVHDLGRDADRTIHAIEELLRSPRDKITHLELCLRNATSLPSATVIHNHSNSLQTLLLDIIGKRVPAEASRPGPPKPNYLCYSTSDFCAVVEACQSLVELGIAFPEVGLEYDELGDCRDFLYWFDGTVMHLPKLATLNVLNWPIGYQFGRSKGYYQTKNLQVARLASDLFKRHNTYDAEAETFDDEVKDGLLRVISFGVLDLDEATTPPPAYFVQAEVTRLGKKQDSAQSVTLDDLREYGLDGAVLKYDERVFDDGCRKRGSDSRVHGGWGGGADDDRW